MSTKEEDDKAREDRAKADADMSKKFDDAMSMMADMAKRMDSYEEGRKADRARKDAEEKKDDADCPRMDGEDDEAWDKRKKDKAKKDAEECAEAEKVAADKKRKDEEDEKKAKDDKAMKDAEEEEAKKKADSALSQRIADMEKLISGKLADRSPEDKARFADSQAEFDRVYRAIGDSAAPPMAGETHGDYERRLLSGLKKFTNLKEVNLHAVHDEHALGALKTAIFADAEAYANSPARVPQGQLRARERSEGGHTIITYEGDSSVWMSPLAGEQCQAVVAFKTGA